MNYKPLPVGIDNFEKLVTRGYYFVDKTLFIKELWDKKGGVNLITRPRRFGKTLNMSMLQYFFEDARDDKGNKIDNSSLFDGLKIMQTGEQYLAHMGQYPVINLTFKEANQPDSDLALYEMQRVISGEFARHSYVMDALKLDVDRELFQNIMEQKADRVEYCRSLQFLSGCLEQYCGRKAIILVDEYDSLLENAAERGFYLEIADFMDSFLTAALKTNASLEFAVITGYLRISKERGIARLYSQAENSIMNNRYDKYFGFTETEVRKICEDYDLLDQYDVVKTWYGGYLIGECSVYNPCSIMRFVQEWVCSGKAVPTTYWEDTASVSVLRKLIDMSNDQVKWEIEKLIAGDLLEKRFDGGLTYDEVYNSVDKMWNFMFYAGYFRKASERIDEINMLYLTLVIPNEEIRSLFRNKVVA